MRPLKTFRPSPALMVAIAALIVALGGVAYATIPDSGGVIHGCYVKDGGLLRVIDPTQRDACRHGQTALNWNQTGPQGQQGLQGPPGLNGASSTSVLAGSTSGAMPLDASHAVFFGLGGAVAVAGSGSSALLGEDGATSVVPRAGTLANLHVHVYHFQGTSTVGDQTFTMRKNGTDTSVTCSIAAASNATGSAPTCSDTSDSISLAAGDQISLRATSTEPGGGNNYYHISWTATYSG